MQTTGVDVQPVSRLPHVQESATKSPLIIQTVPRAYVKVGSGSGIICVLLQGSIIQQVHLSWTMAVMGTPGCAFAAFNSIASSFSRETDLMGMILGLQSTSLKFPFSEYTRPAFGSTCRKCFRLSKQDIHTSSYNAHLLKNVCLTVVMLHRNVCSGAP